MISACRSASSVPRGRPGVRPRPSGRNHPGIFHRGLLGLLGSTLNEAHLWRVEASVLRAVLA